MSNQLAKKEETAVADRKATVAERFVKKVEIEFEGAVGHGVEFTDNEKQLASNLFVKIDSALKQHEADRNSSKQTPYTWDNVNMQKLATDAVHRVRLGLDALIKNHIHVVPYFNSKLGKYDLNLQVGYKGKAYYRKRMAVEDVKDIRYELIHESDEFTVIKKDLNQRVENYEFKVTKPFDRGEVIGGFGYIEFEEESKNKVVTVPESEFIKVKNTAKTKKIWNQWPEKMRLKTLVHRVTDELDMDPQKINPSYSYVEDQEDPFSNPDNEVKLEQPQADQRQDIDIQANEDDSNGSKENGSTQRKKDVETHTESDSSDNDELLAEINKLGKGIYKNDWFKKSKEYLPSDAEYLTDLDLNGLKQVKAALEDKLGVVSDA